ncbi:MAG TPA: serine hydrolase [Clostridia bacterium]|nr:serine hydrolase [Clostridia bacterium]
MHGILFLKQGRIVAEGYWRPFGPECLHRMYSVSKSMVSVAIGLMLDEKRLKLSDLAADYFPDKLPEGGLHPYLARTTIRDLLMMATPHSENAYTAEDSDWLRAFWNKKPSHPPGTVFAYDTAGTVVLTAIVERLSGQSFLDYMRPRLLDPIGFSAQATCIQTPEGYSWGGSGVLCTLRDMAKLAYVLSNRGRWEGRQLLSEAYAEQATSRQIDNTLAGSPGYGYQIWMEPGGFSFYGMGSQHAFCYPEQDLIVATIADTQLDAARARPILLETLRSFRQSVQSEPLPADPDAQAALRDKLESLTLLAQHGAASSPMREAVHGKTYALEDNPMGIKALRFSFQGEEGVLEYRNEQGLCALRFGLCKNVEDRFPERVFRERIGVYTDRFYRCMNSAAWVEPQKLCLRAQIIDDYLGTAFMTFCFQGSEIGVQMAKAAEWFLDRYQGFAGGAQTESDLL